MAHDLHFPTHARLLCVLLCLVLVACGGGSDDAPECRGGVIYGADGVPVTRTPPGSATQMIEAC